MKVLTFIKKSFKPKGKLGGYTFLENEIARAPTGSTATLNGHHFIKTKHKWEKV